MAKMFIGELASEHGLNPRTLRYYETLGLLPPPSRIMNGYRVYGEATVQRLAFITKAKSLGLTLKEIKQILTLRDSGTLPCPSVQRLLQEHVDRIDCQIAQLQALRTDLMTLLNGWHSEKGRNSRALNGSVCPRIEAHGTP